VAMAIIGFVMQIVSKQIIEKEVIAHLETTAQSMEKHIQTLLTGQKEKIEIAATHSELSLEELQEILNINPEFYEIFVLDSEGIIITSTNGSNIGLDRSDDAYFINARNKAYIKPSYFSEETQRNAIAVATPHAGGVLVARIELEYFNNLVADRTGLGETGESLLAYRDENGEPVFFTKRLFEEGELEEHEKEHIVLPIEEALAQKEDIFFEHDYRHISVIAATRYIEEVDMGLVVKIDQAEAFAGTFNILYIFLILVFCCLILYLVVSFWLANILTKPIISLHHGTEIIEKGNLDYKVGTKSKDEVGQLSRSFDKMTAAIKQARKDVDTKIKKQTGHISKQAIKLEMQQKAVLNILEDVEDDKQKVTLERDKINAILHSIGDGVFVLDNWQKIIMYNRVAGEISGYSEQEAIGKKYSDILRFILEKDNSVNDKFIKDVFATGEVQEMQNHTLLITKDGKKVPVADSAAPLNDKDGNVIGCIVVFRDVTIERQIDKMKTEFVSVASHQLRTPLTAIKLFVEMLIKGEVGKLAGKQKSYMQDIQQSTERMIKLVNDLLNVSRLETGKLKVDPKSVQLEDFVQGIMDDVLPLVNKKKCKIALNKPQQLLPSVPIDTTLLGQVIHNLLTNAIRYSVNKKCGIVVALGYGKGRSKSDIIISVQDNGIGIPKKVQPRIFDKFFRADNATKFDPEGSGLGMYVAKMIMEVSGGKIWFESREGKGTTFYVAIPAMGMKQRAGIRTLAG
ncbi:ATP-binding protein, partial [Patescibacteria group bacterium]